MKKIIYYVASSLDGYIAGPGDDISKFALGGKGVEVYQSDLLSFKTVIMGRRTYEFGYQYGLEPGKPAYPHMEHHIFSKTLNFEETAANVHVEKRDLERVKELKKTSPTDIYLCGGGEFAGWLLENDMIDELWIKLNPIILGGGIPLFNNSQKALSLELFATEQYDDGLFINKYNFK